MLFPKYYLSSFFLVIISYNLSSIFGEKHCALLFFGIGRKFKEIAFPSIDKNILNVNPKCDIFVHTYNVTKAYGNRVGEGGAENIHISEILLLAEKSSMIIETEKEFQTQRNVHFYRSIFPRPSHWDYPSSMDNMIRQWHSIEKVWTKMESHEESLGSRYDIVGLFRLDVLFVQPIFLNDTDSVAVIPRLMYKTSQNKHAWGGYNDRLFYGKREYAKLWATGRFYSVPAYMLWQESTSIYEGRKGLHSEDFLRWLLVLKSPTPLTIKPICFKRIRSSGVIINKDCFLF